MAKFISSMQCDLLFILILFLQILPAILIIEVCHNEFQGPCPEDTCCNQSKCDEENIGFKCNENSNCPACSKNSFIVYPKIKCDKTFLVIKTMIRPQRCIVNQLHVSSITVSIQTNCSGTYDDVTMMLSSPENVLESSICWWKITAPPENTVHLRFMSFSLSQSLDCAISSLQVFDGPNARSSTFGSDLCGETSPENIESTGNTLYLLFMKKVTGANQSQFQIKVDVKGKNIYLLT